MNEFNNENLNENLNENPNKNPNEYYGENLNENPSGIFMHSNTQTAPIQVVTMNKKNTNKNKRFKRRAVVTVAAAAVFGISVGLGFGVGFNVSKNISPEENERLNFKFQEAPEIQAMSVVDNNITGIIKNISDSVVNISITAYERGMFNQIYESSGSGSGIIYEQDDEKAYIVTNNHVIDDASSVYISITGNEQIPAKLVGKDAQSDLAVISVLKTDLAKAGINEVKTAVFADSDKVEVGEYVLAIGNALGQGKTVTQGIISAKNRQIRVDGKNHTILQTDAAINPGNSGGALVNSSGEVIGINTAKTSSAQIEGTGYAIPSTTAKDIINQLMTNGTVAKPYLGIEGYTITDDFIRMYNLNTKGVFLTNITSNSAAETAGLKFSDIITGFNGTPIETMEDLSDEISKCKVGDTVTIDIIRNGYEEMQKTAVLTDLNQNF